MNDIWIIDFVVAFFQWMSLNLSTSSLKNAKTKSNIFNCHLIGFCNAITARWLGISYFCSSSKCIKQISCRFFTSSQHVKSWSTIHTTSKISEFWFFNTGLEGCNTIWRSWNILGINTSNKSTFTSLKIEFLLLRNPGIKSFHIYFLKSWFITSEHGAVMPRHPTCQNSLFLGSRCPPEIVSSSLGENLKSLASWPSLNKVSYILIAVLVSSGSSTAILSLS